MSDVSEKTKQKPNHPRYTRTCFGGEDDFDRKQNDRRCQQRSQKRYKRVLYSWCAPNTSAREVHLLYDKRQTRRLRFER